MFHKLISIIFNIGIYIINFVSFRTKKDRQMLNRTQIRYFRDVAGYEGLFLCGPYPHWILLSGRGELRTHPMGIDSSIPCFAAFHNVNCPKGFIYFNRKGVLRICVLPTHLSYGAPWPVRKYIHEFFDEFFNEFF